MLIYFDCDDSLILRGVYSSDCSVLIESEDEYLYKKIMSIVKYILDFLKTKGNIFSIGIYPLCSDMLLVEDYEGYDVYVGSRKSDLGIGRELYDIAIFI